MFIEDEYYINRISSPIDNEDNKVDKYRYQKKYHKKVGIRTKTYRMKTDTIERILNFSKNHNESQASILRNAYKRYSEHQLSFFLRYWEIKDNFKFDTRKGFKMKQELVNQIEETCKTGGFSKGAFVSLIIDDYIAERSKEKNKPWEFNCSQGLFM